MTASRLFDSHALLDFRGRFQGDGFVARGRDVGGAHKVYSF